MVKLFSILLVLSLGVACSSRKKVKDVDNSETISKDYLVKDASSNLRPGWIEDPQIWAAQENMNTDKYRFFAFETGPKVNREIACSLAKANVRADIAGEITTFIQKSLASSTEGAASIDSNNPKTQAMREFVSDTLAERVQSLINGAAVIKTYWEKRNYMKKMGAKKDYFGFTCASLVRIENDRLKAAIDKASEDLVKKTDDPETKENVKKALKNLDEDFLKARQGEV